MKDMAFIDANYILRYLLQDHPKQFSIAKEVIENEVVTIPDFIFAEVDYVLEKVYRVGRKDIKVSHQNLLDYKNLRMENKSIIVESLNLYCSYKVDFADALLVAYHKMSLSTKLYSFDKKVLKLS